MFPANWRNWLLLGVILLSAPCALHAAPPIAPDEIDPETAAATEEDLIDPTLPSKKAIQAATAEPRSLTPPQTDAATPLVPGRPKSKSAPKSGVSPVGGTTPKADEPEKSDVADKSDVAGKSDGPGDGEPLVRKAFARSKTAQDEAGLTEILEMCNEGVQAGVNGPMVPYTRQFMAWAHNRRGELRSDADRNAEALEDFAMAVRLDETKWRHFHNRGVSLATLAKYDAAVADFDQTIRMNPNYANAYFNRGELKYEKQEYPGAIQDYSQAIRLAPKDAAAYNSRGHAQYRMQHFREAMDDYNQAVRLDPSSAAAYTNRGDAWADQGQYAEAAHDYRMAIKLSPNLGRAYQSAAWLMATCPDENFRNPALAVEAAEKAIALDGDVDYRYVETLAAAQASGGDYDTAAATQKKVIELAPPDQRPRATSRLELYHKGQPYREAARAAPQNRESLRTSLQTRDYPQVRPLERP